MSFIAKEKKLLLSPSLFAKQKTQNDIGEKKRKKKNLGQYCQQRVHYRALFINKGYGVKEVILLRLTQDFNFPL